MIEGGLDNPQEMMRSTYLNIDALRTWLRDENTIGTLIPHHLPFHILSFPTYQRMENIESVSPNEQSESIVKMLGVLPLLHIASEQASFRSRLKDQAIINKGRAAMQVYFSAATHGLSGGDPEKVAQKLRYMGQTRGFYEAYMEDRSLPPQLLIKHGSFLRSAGIPPLTGHEAYAEVFHASKDLSGRDPERLSQFVYDVNQMPSYEKSTNTLTIIR